jgi:hypothetical protein
LLSNYFSGYSQGINESFVVSSGALIVKNMTDFGGFQVNARMKK